LFFSWRGRQGLVEVVVVQVKSERNAVVVKGGVDGLRVGGSVVAVGEGGVDGLRVGGSVVAVGDWCD
jgi:hypothetical protein